MSLTVVQRWYDTIPSLERNQALVIAGTKAYTPNQVLDEVKRGTDAGQMLQKVIEAKKFTDAVDKFNLATIRIKERLSKAPATFKVVVGQRSYTPREMLEQIANGTQDARTFIEMETKRIDQVLK